ncbi:MAG: glycosyltransferase family 2 protein [Chitinophagaceae bacterium]
MKIAVLLTTFNRKHKTVACLESVKRQLLPHNAVMEVFLTDDASSDGTVDAVKYIFPDAHIFHGNGSLFWAGGMRHSWKQALAYHPDYYLLLNDDTVLTSTAVADLLKYNWKENDKTSKPAICIGSTVDDHTGKISYGGRRLSSKLSWNSGYLVHSETEYMSCDVANANIMLVPRQITEEIGTLSPAYTHGLADYDYSLKAKKAGFDLLVVPGFLGSCVDDHGNNWKSTNVTLTERIKYLKSPKGLAYKEYLKFIKDHFPLSYPSAFCKLWIKTLFPVIWDRFKK